MPVDRGDYLEMYVNQWGEGDYQGDICVIFRSCDEGLTWEFIEEKYEKNYLFFILRLI